MKKVHLFPLPAEEIREGLYSVIAGALAGGAPEPSWVAVDDGTDAWVVEVSAFSEVERTRGVVAASSEEALVKAQRFGVGGAMWLPPASLGALEAFTAAASGETPRARDATAIDMLDGKASIQVVSFCNRPFWRAQLGDRRLETMLAELAVSLEAPVAILQWPALVLAEREPGDIIDAWEKLAAEQGRARPAVSVLSPTATEMGILADAYAALTSDTTTDATSSSMPAQPVHELPHGRRVGWWDVGVGDASEDEGWLAGPENTTSTPVRWRLDGAETSGIVEEVLTSENVVDLEQVLGVRLPGWASQGLCAGSPAGLLITRIAENASRRGLPLWIPNIDQEGLRFVLGLPGTIWVDGPAVPS